MYYGDKKIKDVNYGGIPIKKAYYGSQLVWEKKQEGVWENGYEGIDLELPSGIIWATIPFITYANFTLTKYVVAVAGLNVTIRDIDASWGGRWRLPSAEEVTELLNNTTAGISNINDRYYTSFLSNNGRGIMLPHFGYVNDSPLVTNPVNSNTGYYWTSTEKDENDGYRLELSKTNTAENVLGSGDKNLYRTAWLVFNPKD